ncbi:MAG: hypothetical protein WCF54_05090 [Terracidiphilus sp.]
MTKPYLNRIIQYMVKAKKRVQKGRISTSRDKRIQALLKNLNGGPYFENGCPVENSAVLLVGFLQTLDELFRRNRQLFRRDKGKHVEIYQKINQLFKYYSVSPKILDSFQHGRPNPRGWEATWFWTTEPIEECRDMNYLLTAMELAQSGRIHLLKKCPKCAEWLFARVSSQKFCSNDCRNQFHISNEADKERRAAWARENYARKVKAQKGV